MADIRSIGSFHRHDPIGTPSAAAASSCLYASHSKPSPWSYVKDIRQLLPRISDEGSQFAVPIVSINLGVNLKHNFLVSCFVF